MKKFFIPALAAVFVLGMTSCKKDWSCRCTTTVLGVTTESVVTIPDATKSEAEEQCTGSVSTGGASASCALD